jgi:hypothetical protein
VFQKLEINVFIGFARATVPDTSDHHSPFQSRELDEREA